MLILTFAHGETVVYQSVSRFCTDEHNNLCIHDTDGELMVLCAAGQWRSAVLDDKEI